MRPPVPPDEELTRLSPPADGETRLDTDRANRSGPGLKSSSSSSGWLSSSGAIDHGRFPPGTLLGGRYRIVGRAGRGGMGEVYRADDLKLGQPVALKFLPPDVDRDPARLTQLHTEVRMARQVSHPNVCRVYDIDEVDGHTFLSMEFVDGEDLSALLKRIGRFPGERGLEIARQLCAGMAAAHERGVVHRDFKPANVMLDAAGKVRITDFGLAGAAGEAIRAGTPAYMAPEQLSGGQVTARSDIYALGLVLYEIFTGQRALDGRNVAELIRQREQAGIVPPSELVRDLDQDVERVILRCLRPEPEQRPASALTVAAALPGGDPLAAALAAGETPSPEMVAAAGGLEALPLRATLAGAAWIGASLIALVLIYQHVMLINRVPTPKPPEALEDRALEALARLGYTAPPADTAWGLGYSTDYLNFLSRTDGSADRWDRLAHQRPEAFFLWHRTSPLPLVPFGSENTVQGTNPPMTVAGMTLILVDASGRVAEFLAVPDPIRDAPAVQAPVNWQTVFDVTGLPMAAFKPVPPRWNPAVFADQQMAWEGTLPELTEHTLRLEAAAYAGRPVSIVVTGPWSVSARTVRGTAPLFNRALNNIQTVVMPALMLAAAFLARRNLKIGRGDRIGARRAALFVLATAMASWLLRGTIGVFQYDVNRFFDATARGLFDAGILWVTYLGLEPYIRRYAPDTLIGWTRLVSGRWKDPRVATDVMIGVCCGLAMTLIYAVHNLLPPLYGQLEPRPFGNDVSLLLGTRQVAGYLLSRIGSAIQGAMLCVVGVVALQMLLKRRWVATATAVIVFTPVAINGMFPAGTPWLDVGLGVALIGVFVAVIQRFGLLSTTAALITHFLLLRAPITTQLSTWRGLYGLWFVGAVAILGFGACYLASGRGLPHAGTGSR